MFAIVDIETTGGFSAAHKITEIAILIHDGEKVVQVFESLIHPERYISPHISMLTGITNEMVREAPKFYEVAKEIFLMTQDKIFVAHNVNFDYSFLKQEFQQLGGTFDRQRLCTVKLARQIFPGQKSYSLGKLCASLGIPLRNRHRAMGDAEATAVLFSKMVNEDPEKRILNSARKLNFGCTLPPSLPADVFRNLPLATGVYYFHDERGQVIYVGKAKEIKKRIQQHFSGAAGAKIDFQERIHNITFQLTGTELIALLLESYEIKRLWPAFNRQQKNLRSAYVLMDYFDGNGIHRLGLSRNRKNIQALAGFNSFQDARNFLQRLCDEDELCPKCCGLQQTNGVCFDFTLHKCKGICAGKEGISEYNLRVQETLRRRLGELETHIIVGAGRNETEKSVVLVERGEYKGFGYCDLETPLFTAEDCHLVIQPFPDNSDIRKILRSFLNSQSMMVFE